MKTIISSLFMILVSVPLYLLEIPLIILIKFLHNGEHHFSLMMKIDCFLVFTKGLKKSLKIHLADENILDTALSNKISKTKKSSKEIGKNDLYAYNLIANLQRLSNDTLSVVVRDEYEPDYALAYSNESYAIESQWSYPWKNDYFLISLMMVSLKTSKRITISRLFIFKSSIFHLFR